jgi:hypothetical protein
MRSAAETKAAQPVRATEKARTSDAGASVYFRTGRGRNARGGGRDATNSGCLKGVVMPAYTREEFIRMMLRRSLQAYTNDELLSFYNEFCKPTDRPDAEIHNGFFIVPIVKED